MQQQFTGEEDGEPKTGLDVGAQEFCPLGGSNKPTPQNDFQEGYEPASDHHDDNSPPEFNQKDFSDLQSKDQGAHLNGGYQ